MGDFDLATARRFDGVQFVRGMMVRIVTDRDGSMTGPRLMRTIADDAVLLEFDDASTWRYTTVADDIVVLDYTDPGTLGHVLAAVGAAHCDPDAFITTVPPLCTWWVAIDGVAKFDGGTRIAALAAAWEGRPK